MSYYWISWVQPGDDVRPLHYPPGERVLCSVAALVLHAIWQAAPFR